VTQLPEQGANATLGANSTGMAPLGVGLLGAAAQFASRNATGRNMTGVSALPSLKQSGATMDCQWEVLEGVHLLGRCTCVQPSGLRFGCASVNPSDLFAAVWCGAKWVCCMSCAPILHHTGIRFS
jgi:hypothetical protein